MDEILRANPFNDFTRSFAIFAVCLVQYQAAGKRRSYSAHGCSHRTHREKAAMTSLSATSTRLDLARETLFAKWEKLTPEDQARVKRAFLPEDLLVLEQALETQENQAKIGLATL